VFGFVGKCCVGFCVVGFFLVEKTFFLGLVLGVCGVCGVGVCCGGVGFCLVLVVLVLLLGWGGGVGE